jgi:hypothetical protein
LAASLDGLTIVKARQDGSNRGNFSKVISGWIAASWRHARGGVGFLHHRHEKRCGGMRRFLAEHLGVFGPDEIRILAAAFDKAWEAVQASGVIYAKDKTELVRAILAKHIIAAAKDGEYDQGRLRDGALLALAQSNLRGGPRPQR